MSNNFNSSDLELFGIFNEKLPQELYDVKEKFNHIFYSNEPCSDGFGMEILNTLDILYMQGRFKDIDIIIKIVNEFLNANTKLTDSNLQKAIRNFNELKVIIKFVNSIATKLENESLLWDNIYYINNFDSGFYHFSTTIENICKDYNIPNDWVFSGLKDFLENLSKIIYKSFQNEDWESIQTTINYVLEFICKDKSDYEFKEECYFMLFDIHHYLVKVPFANAQNDIYNNREVLEMSDENRMKLENAFWDKNKKFRSLVEVQILDTIMENN